MKLSELAQKTATRLKGEGNKEIHFIKDVNLLKGLPEKNTIYYVESRKYLKSHPEVSQADAVLTTSELEAHFTNALVCESSEARLKFIALLEVFAFAYKPQERLSAQAYIHPTAKVASSAIIYPHAVVLEGAEIGEYSEIHSGVVVEPFAKIGKYTVIHPNCVIGYRTQIGDYCRIFGGTIIGADGFGFYDHRPGERYKIPQIGNVVIGNHVEIGANCTIDRATIESTRIGDHTKLDDQVHIGHNCQIGSYVFMAGCAVLAGSVKVEDHAIIAGQATIAEGVTIKSGAILLGMSATQRDLEGGQAYLGAVQAMPVRLMHRVTSLLMDLPQIVERISSLEKIVETLKNQSKES
ncbi:MAG: UDP-3-O-(3-hydroxymyristoyl)glucosamine N-acyltransferase [Leptospiraceae bacterium]|nr:UDP-3-O-(3-hydroxymyristoyl)glucosamine N-acyltransferase [Leptospiraceae bacterium]MDW8306763.1 UDP-3-O-(3-hydroxymyristoyl)glucosamine N-acyltransferase [Leptospiraceae bacterium]